MYLFQYKTYPAPQIDQSIVCEPLPDDVADRILMNCPCHVDHEGFDLNEIEQEYYKQNRVSIVNDSTWYKDGGQSNGTNAIILPWVVQSDSTDLIIDHSHFVIRYPIFGKARDQITKYAANRPELFRLLSSQFKCGLDLCIDLLSDSKVQPVVHIEWDFDNSYDLQNSAFNIETLLAQTDWNVIVPAILNYNKLARLNKVDAFAQADTRAMLLFGEKSYKLLPTI